MIARSADMIRELVTIFVVVDPHRRDTRLLPSQTARALLRMAPAIHGADIQERIRMSFRTLDGVDLKGKRVLVRVDLNVPDG